MSETDEILEKIKRAIGNRDDEIERLVEERVQLVQQNKQLKMKLSGIESEYNNLLAKFNKAKSAFADSLDRGVKNG